MPREFHKEFYEMCSTLGYNRAESAAMVEQHCYEHYINALELGRRRDITFWGCEYRAARGINDKLVEKPPVQRVELSFEEQLRRDFMDVITGK